MDEKDALAGGSQSYRHTLDVRGAQANAGEDLSFNVYGVSDVDDPTKQKVSLYDTENLPPPGRQLKFNPGNLKLYAAGKKPFMGDYIATAGVQWIPNGNGGWVFNGLNADPTNTILRTFQTAWADNRDALVNEPDLPPNSDVPYVRPGTPCTPGSSESARVNSRNANVYTSRITPGLYLSALGNTKPTDQIERAFAVSIENGTQNAMDVALTIDASGAVPVSFTQPATNNTRTMPVPLHVGRLSSSAVTVYVGPTPSVKYPPVWVTATSMTDPSLRAQVLLNGDPTNPLIQQPINGSESIGGKDTHTPRVQAPRVQAKAEAPRVQAPRVQAPRVQATQVEEPRVQAPRVQAAQVEAPRVQAESYQDKPFVDITYDMTNDGNTTSAVNLNVSSSVPTTGYNFQLIVWRGYAVSVAGPDCMPAFAEVPQVLFNDTLTVGDLGFGGLPDLLQPKVVVRPGEIVRWTLRAFDIEGPSEPFCTEQMSPTPGPTDCTSKLSVTAEAQAVNTGESEPPSSVVGPADYLVTNTNDSGPGSLRQAILDANSHSPYADRIGFAISGTAPYTIALASPLPGITEPVTIDATTQPGWAAFAPVIELSGTNLTGTAIGLAISSGNSAVRGLVINGFGDAAISLTGAVGGNSIEGNFIGTNVTGDVAVSNGDGVRVASPNNRIGGTWPARNLISGNTASGVSISGAGNFVQGNFIGLDRSGLQAIPVGASAQSFGVLISNGANNTIGGLAWDNRNIISGNGKGVEVTGALATGNGIRGNCIGTDRDCYIARPNEFGIYLTSGASGNTIGGPGPNDLNIIARNSLHGLWIYGGANNNIVRGNHIGVGYDGVSNIGNVGDGLVIGCEGGGCSANNSNGNTIGGMLEGEGNIVAFNGAAGISVRSGVGNRISGNRIFSNLDLGIDLNPQGVNPNDVGDGDPGPNQSQNYPVLASAFAAATATYVSGSLNSTSVNPGPTYQLEFFGSTVCVGSGNGEGRRFLGSTSVTTDPTGNVVFTAVPVGPTTVGESVTATATDPNGNTSEFSACVPVQSGNGSGEVKDATGDLGGGPDLWYARVVVQGDSVTLQVRFGSGFDQATTVVQFLFDTDLNVNTGHPTATAGCSPAEVGAEYLLQMGQNASQATILPYLDTCNSFGADVTGSKPVTYTSTGDGMDVTFARSLIGNYDGQLNFKVSTFTYTGSGYTVVQDMMPDAGSPTAHVRR